MDVGDDSSSGNGSLDEGVKLLISTDGELQVTGSDTLHLKILARVSGKLKDLGGKVLKDCGGVHGSGGSNTLLALDGALQETVDTTDRELKSGLARAAGGLLLGGGGLSSLSSLSSFSSLQVDG